MGREARPSSKKALRSSGWYLGWSCMSWRQAVVRRIAMTRGASGLAFVRNFADLPRLQALQKLSRRFFIEQRIGRLNAQEEPVSRCVNEPLHVEHGMVRHGKSIQPQHPQYSDERREQDRHFKRHRNE